MCIKQLRIILACRQKMRCNSAALFRSANVLRRAYAHMHNGSMMLKSYGCSLKNGPKEMIKLMAVVMLI